MAYFLEVGFLSAPVELSSVNTWSPTVNATCRHVQKFQEGPSLQLQGTLPDRLAQDSHVLVSVLQPALSWGGKG